MNLSDFREKLKADLGISTELSQDELDRAVERAVEDLSRHLPREAVIDLTLDFSIVGEAWTANQLLWVTLANSPIKYGSEVVKDSTGATAALGTDYKMDYINGRIARLGGIIGATEACTIDYTIVEQSAHLDTLFASAPSGVSRSDLIRIEYMVYQTSPTTLQNVKYQLWNDYITMQFDASTIMADDAHLLAYIQLRQDPPTATSDGSYNAVLDEVVAKGAAAYAMFMLASKQKYLAVADLALARTTLDLSTDYTAIDTAITLISNILSDVGRINVAGNSISTFITAIGNANTNLTTAQTYLSNLLNEGTGSLIAWARAYLVSGANYASAADSRITDTNNGMKTLLAKVGTEVTAAKEWLNNGDNPSFLNYIKVISEASPWDDVVSRLTSAELFVNTGTGLINTINTGNDVAALYEKYAELRVTMATLEEEKRKDYIAGANQYASAAQVGASFAGHYANMAYAYSNAAGAMAQAANAMVGAAAALYQEMGHRVEAAQVESVLAQRILDMATLYKGVCEIILGEAQQTIAKVNTLVQLVQTKIGAAQSYQANGEKMLAIADKFLAEGDQRRGEFWKVLEEKGQYRKESSVIIGKQPVR